MALFTDGEVSITADLVGYESAILDVAGVEGIDLPSKLKLAGDEIGIELGAFLTARGREDELGSVVVTAPLQKWHTFRTLVLAYRDAYHRQVNDRYRAKWVEYERRARWAWDALVESGLGMALDPVPRAQKPQLTSAAAQASAATYYVRAAWQNAAGQEGSPSELAMLAAGEGMTVVAGLPDAPDNAAGWNVYAGHTAADLAKQNAAPLGVRETWTAAAGLIPGPAPGNGQAPAYYLRMGRTIPRG